MTLFAAAQLLPVILWTAKRPENGQGDGLLIMKINLIRGYTTLPYII